MHAMTKIRTTDNGTAPGRGLMFWCPGCDDAHRIAFDCPNGWTWDGNEEAPTISPSIKVTGVQWDEGSPFHKPKHAVAPGQQTTCHSFIRNGVWDFLGDCTHSLAGQQVPMVDLPDWLDPNAA